MNITFVTSARYPLSLFRGIADRTGSIRRVHLQFSIIYDMSGVSPQPVSRQS